MTRLLVNARADNARALLPRADVVDQLNRQLHRELASFMIEQPANIPRCLHLMGVAKAFERVADHATNIAEEVVYLYEGKDIRHTRA
jgi:phosphate transport system protein